MAIQNWKDFLTPYDQAVSELKVKLRSIRKEFRRKNEYSPNRVCNWKGERGI